MPIYLDNAASTRVSDEVIALITEVMRTAWGNPSAAHPQGAAARAYIDKARTQLFHALGDASAQLGELVFTSGCTEADALAVTGVARAKPGAIVLTAIEHPAVSAACARLATEGRSVIHVPCDADGIVDPDAVAAALRGLAARGERAAIVSVVMVQNEIGVVQPVQAIAAAVKRESPTTHVHVDAAQALGKVPIDVRTLGVDSLAIAGHKLHGPKGTGALWLRTGVELEPLWVGGGQQGGLRGGTQDAPGAAGLGLAARLAVEGLSAARTRWLELAVVVTSRLEQRGVAFRQLVPDRSAAFGVRSPHILALGFPGVPASALRSVLSSRGVYISTGSSCAERDSKPSAILEAIGLPEDTGMARLSFALDTTVNDVETAAAILADVVLELRARS